MKKITKFVMVFAAMTALTFSFAGCNNNNDTASQASLPSTVQSSQAIENSVELSSTVEESSQIESETEESSTGDSSGSGFDLSQLFGGSEVSVSSDTDTSTETSIETSIDTSGNNMNAMIKAYFETDEGKKQLEEFSKTYSNDEFEMNMLFEDDAVVIELKAKKQADLSAYTSSEIEALFDQSIQSELQSQGAQSQFDMLAQYGLTVKARVLNADGTVLYDKAVITPSSSSSSSVASVPSTSYPSVSSVPSVSVSPSSGKTIKDYYNEHASEFTSLETSLSSSSQTMKIYPDGNDTLVFECTLMQDISPSSEVTSLFESEFGKQRSTFEAQVATIKKEAEVDRLTLTVKYLNQNGELLYEDSVS